MRIGEIAARTGASPRSLRYYEQQGLLAPSRTASGQREYTAADEAAVRQIQELLGAGICSAVIQELLPALSAPARDQALLGEALAAAENRLHSERHEIEEELAGLARLRERLGLDPDTHVRDHDGPHERSDPTPPAAPDHRDRRLR
ncbi:MerR family transcriptional regulator [Brachybacterium sp. YJGR34]|uniref:MerR family transcriptional regulator n=1 Tax=Brachybacterium sp. YJGR34 TaxID=2059911 RepID=UPI000E0B9E2B|nr:MerR family transcriptional regulator [Brachybacterium sp. YJGR34]